MNIPYDPDFDEPQSKPGASTFFDAFSGKAAFWLGVAVAIGVLATIGFIVLLLALL